MNFFNFSLNIALLLIWPYFVVSYANDNNNSFQHSPKLQTLSILIRRQIRSHDSQVKSHATFINNSMNAKNLMTKQNLNGSEDWLLPQMNDAKVNKSKDPKKNIKIRKLKRRSISSAVIESAHCEHIELIECDAYDSEDMKCLISATGMPCCICTGKLRSLRKIKKWIMW